MRRNIHPVEELFEIRAELRALKAREAELRAFFLDRAGPSERVGPFHKVAITHQRRRCLDRARLPPAILADPRIWDTRESNVVKIVRRAETPVCGGFAAPDPPSWSAPRFEPVADDPLFEPFA